MISAIETQIVTLLHDVFAQFGWLGVAAVMAFENATSLTPSEVVLTLAGWLLIAQPDAPVYTIFLAGLYAALGSTMGSSLVYWTVRLGGRPLVERVFRRLRLKPAYLTRSEAQFRRWGPGLILFGRLVPAVRILVTLPAALARVPYLQFCFYTLLGTYLWCTSLLGLGYLVGHRWRHVGGRILSYAPWVMLALLALAGLILVARLVLQRRLQPEPAAIEEEE